jgi:hypothetical protein
MTLNFSAQGGDHLVGGQAGLGAFGQQQRIGVVSAPSNAGLAATKGLQNSAQGLAEPDLVGVFQAF